MVEAQKAAGTPDHSKSFGYDFKQYCDEASLLNWKNTAILASAAILLQSSLI